MTWEWIIWLAIALITFRPLVWSSAEPRYTLRGRRIEQ